MTYDGKKSVQGQNIVLLRSESNKELTFYKKFLPSSIDQLGKCQLL